MKIYVLGSTGMLGRYIYTYFKDKYETICLSRNNIDVSEITEVQLTAKLFEANLKENDVVINCIGTIKPMVDSLGDLNAIKVNSVFPRILANSTAFWKAKLIHPTTDCVFTGKKGNYTETDSHDVTDVYGRTKSLGEPNNCTVIRTSIIGEEVNQNRSLVEWIKSQNNKTVNGFTNHFWNGVTCLQLAKICEQIINQNLFWKGVKHVFSNTVTKEELLKLVIKHYELNINVNSIKAQDDCDRSLSSTTDFYKTFNIPVLDYQIRDMKNFSSTLYEKA